MRPGFEESGGIIVLSSQRRIIRLTLSPQVSQNMHTRSFSRLAIAIGTANVAAAAVLVPTPVNPPSLRQPRNLDLLQPNLLQQPPNQTQLTGYDLVQAGTLVRPQANATIGQWVVANPPDNIANQSSLLLQKCVGTVDNVDVSALNVSDWSCSLATNLVARDGPGRRLPFEVDGVRPPRLHAPRYNVLYTKTWSATYVDADGIGYNITLPAGLCPDNVIGDVESPYHGQMVYNATLLSLYQSLIGLSLEQLYNYTLTMMEAELENLYAALDAIICDPPVGGSRTLLVEPQDMTGRITLILVARVGGFAMTVGALFSAITHEGLTVHVPPVANVFLVAGVGVIAAVFERYIKRLKDRGDIQVVEAMVANVFINAAAQIRLNAIAVWSLTCTMSGIVVENIKKLLVGNADGIPQALARPDGNDDGVAIVPQDREGPLARIGGFCS